MTSEADTYAQARARMVAEQLRRRGIASPRILQAIARLPREKFLSPQQQPDAYADRAVAIDCEQTISQPYIVALMTQALELTGGETVLEVGTGSGYQTALLAELAGRVISIERHAELSRKADLVLQELGYRNITLLVGDGNLGWPASAPYDRIIVTAAAAHIPPPLWEQLTEGGLLVIPLGATDAQVLQAIRKLDGQPHTTTLSGCRFVPLIGAQESLES